MLDAYFDVTSLALETQAVTVETVVYQDEVIEGGDTIQVPVKTEVHLGEYEIQPFRGDTRLTTTTLAQDATHRLFGPQNTLIQFGSILTDAAGTRYSAEWVGHYGTHSEALLKVLETDAD